MRPLRPCSHPLLFLVHLNFTNRALQGGNPNSPIVTGRRRKKKEKGKEEAEKATSQHLFWGGCGLLYGLVFFGILVAQKGFTRGEGGKKKKKKGRAHDMHLSSASDLIVYFQDVSEFHSGDQDLNSR